MKKRYFLLLVLVVVLITTAVMVGRRLNLEGIGKTYGYLGIFGISLGSCMTIVFPIPYIPALITISATTSYSPFWMGIFGGVGAAIGEFTGYILGRSGVRTFPEWWHDKIDLAKKFFDKYGFWSIVLVTATPLPVGVMYLAAGVAGYSPLKLLVAGIIGKVLFVWSMVYVGDYFYPIPHESVFALLIEVLAVFILVYFFGLYERFKKMV